MKTSCNCPYDYGNLCKHKVAALNFIMKYKKLEASQKKIFKNDISKEKHDEICLENHLITDALFKSICIKSNEQYLRSYYVTN
ncbi:MAG: SWIM zinc finger family protein, partial [Polaribacter sp.]